MLRTWTSMATAKPKTDGTDSEIEIDRNRQIESSLEGRSDATADRTGPTEFNRLRRSLPNRVVDALEGPLPVLCARLARRGTKARRGCGGGVAASTRRAPATPPSYLPPPPPPPLSSTPTTPALALRRLPYRRAAGSAPHSGADHGGGFIARPFGMTSATWPGLAAGRQSLAGRQFWQARPPRGPGRCQQWAQGRRQALAGLGLWPPSAGQRRHPITQPMHPPRDGNASSPYCCRGHRSIKWDAKAKPRQRHCMFEVRGKL